jgi:predicted esterase
VVPVSARTPFDRSIATGTHGHYWVRPGSRETAPWIVGFHGYGENAAAHQAALERIPGSEHWTLVAVQGLHPFYTRSQEIVASWMTRLDRDEAIADNVAYVEKVVAAVRTELAVAGDPVFAGFSQGVAMAYRAAAALPARAVLALAGDVPPEIDVRRLPPVFLGRGARDEWYTETKMASDLERLAQVGIVTTPVVYQGGHEWNEEILAACGEWLGRLG